MALEAVRSGSHFYGTSLNSVVSAYDRLADRISWSLGYPMINLEIHKNQLYENITIAVEFFTKFAGYSTEYLVFNSTLYEKGKGIRLDKLFSITPDLSATYTSVKLNVDASNPRSVTTTLTAGSGAQPIYEIDVSDTVLDPTEFVIQLRDPDTKHSSVRKVLMTVQHVSGDPGETTGSFAEYNVVHTSEEDLGTFSFELSGAHEEIVRLMITPNSNMVPYSTAADNFINATAIASDQLEVVTTTTLSGLAFGAFDSIVNDYRKVVDVFNFEEGSTTGVNTLFTIEQTLAQQTYFSYSMGNYGFDLVSWYTVKEFLDTREKLLSQRRAFEFNPHNQYLRMYPEPKAETFYGIIGCYLEKRVEDMIYEQWIYQYALALSKISIGRVRGKYSGMNLFGGGTLDADLLNEGREEKKDLEQLLLDGTPGFGDADPPMFFIG